MHCRISTSCVAIDRIPIFTALAIFLSFLAFVVFTPSVGAQIPQATAIAVGGDGLTRLLWNNSNKSVSLWRINNDGIVTTFTPFGPFNGYSGQSVAVGSETGASGNVSRILWKQSNYNQVALWGVDNQGNITSYQYPNPPDSTYSPVAVALGPNNVARLLMDRSDGLMTLWNMSDPQPQNSYFYDGPYTNYTAVGLAVGTDSMPCILWNNTDGSLALWRVNSPTNINYGYAGPYGGYTVTAMTVDASNSPRILWNHPGDNTISLWKVAPNYSTSLAASATNVYYNDPPGFTPKALAGGADGKVRILWTKPDGGSQVWVINTDGTQDTYGVVSLALSPSSVSAGVSTIGTVTINQAAGPGGVTVALSTDNSGVMIPATVTIPAGQTYATFTVSTKAAAGGTTANIIATRNTTATTTATMPLFISAYQGSSNLYVSYSSQTLGNNQQPYIDVVDTNSFQIITPAGKFRTPIPTRDGTDNSGIAVAPDGTRIYVGQHTISCFDVTGNIVPNTVTSTQVRCEALTISPDGKHLYGTDGYGGVTAFDVTNPTAPSGFPQTRLGTSYDQDDSSPTGENFIAVSPDNQLLAVCYTYQQNEVAIYNTNNLTSGSVPVKTFTAYPTSDAVLNPLGCVFSKDSSTLYVTAANPSGSNRTVAALSIPPGTTPGAVTYPFGSPSLSSTNGDICLASDGSTLYTPAIGAQSPYPGYFDLISTKGGANPISEYLVTPASAYLVRGVAHSVDGKHIYTSYWDGTSSTSILLEINSSTGQVTRSLTANGRIRALATAATY